MRDSSLPLFRRGCGVNSATGAVNTSNRPRCHESKALFSLFCLARSSTFFSCPRIPPHASLFLSFACPKERNKEKGSQIQLLRWIWQGSRTSYRTTHLITYHI